MANRERFEVFSGENRTLTMHARDSSNAPANLTGLTLTCCVGRPPNVPWMDSSLFQPAVSVTNAATGLYTATIQGGDTEGLHGEYVHQTTDQNGVVYNQGRLLIRRSILP